MATTPALDPIPAQAPAPTPPSLPRGRSIVHRGVLTLYRVFAIVALYGILFGILSYAFVMAFYAINSTWAAPVILSASDEKSLDFLQKLVTSRQTIEDLKVDILHQQTTLAEMNRHRNELEAIDPDLQHAINREHNHDIQTGPELAELDAQKIADNTRTRQILAQLDQLESTIHKDLAAGLITKSDASAQLASINQSRNAYTDSRIAEVLLTDSVLEKTTTGTKSLDVLEKQAELRSEIAQLDVTLSVAQLQLQEDNRQLTQLRSAIATAKQSPYYLNAPGPDGVVPANSGRLYFAFVSYDNQASAKVGAPIYDCYLNMVLCRKVGTVKQIFLGEQETTHPIFKTQVRGFTILMDLSRPNSAKSKTVFLAGKPLWF